MRFVFHTSIMTCMIFKCWSAKTKGMHTTSMVGKGRRNEIPFSKTHTQILCFYILMSMQDIFSMHYYLFTWPFLLERKCLLLKNDQEKKASVNWSEVVLDVLWERPSKHSSLHFKASCPHAGKVEREKQWKVPLIWGKFLPLPQPTGFWGPPSLLCSIHSPVNLTAVSLPFTRGNIALWFPLLLAVPHHTPAHPQHNTKLSLNSRP